VQTPQPIHFAKTTWENDSLFSEQFGDIYFSTHGGREESEEVYLRGNQLAERFSECSSFVIGEIGFGTALNFALTLELWKKCSREDSRLFYLSYEKYPLEPSQIEIVLMSQGVQIPLIDHILAKLPLPVESVHVVDLPEFRTRLLLFYGDASEKLKQTSAEIDAWYLDGFSPSKNPECWSEEVIGQVSRLSHDQTTAATYSVAGVVRERLGSFNWQVEKILGGGSKKQILIAKFRGPKKSNPAAKNFRVGVVGAGLAGCSAAESFSRRGAEVTLFEARRGLALAASGNELGVVLPYPSRGRDIPHRFFTTAFLYLTSVLDRFGIEREGVLFQPLKDRKGGYFDDYSKYEYPKEFAQVLSAAESSALAGVEVTKTNLYFPSGGTISFAELCNKLVADSGVVHLNTPISEISQIANNFDVIVLASGSNFNLFPEMIRSFLHPLKGEVGLVMETEISKKLKIPICDGGYVCPSRNGLHLIGSTYERGISDESLSESGELELGNVFNGFFPKAKAEFVG